MAVRHKDLRILIGRPRLETRLRRFLGLASLSLVEVSGLLLQISCWLSCLYEEDNPTSSNNSLSFPLSQVRRFLNHNHICSAVILLIIYDVKRGEKRLRPYLRIESKESRLIAFLLALSFKVGYDGRSSEL
ncbi:hypothetical protein NC653_023156 [Populus alba x Populus x berolinensis]|uniref:Uncharacterized protein n=1 Tax=Populus alba x Populus x berolinensis TaxID=444605 RepID=A0AAD6MGF6_9ROSI|nr:hypothetical protein NC653_023156 [Populus alba x Populus x berolinensis]